MRKLILALSICALIPMVSVAVAYAEDDEDIEFVDEEEYDTDDYDDGDAEESDTDLEETRVVAKKRMSCDDIKKAMAELNANPDLGEEEQVKLDSLKNDYRSKCSKKTGGGRRGVGRSKAKATVGAVRAVNNARSQQMAAGCDTPDANGCCPGETYTDLGDDGVYCCTANNEACFPPMQVPSVPSLCDDGSKPDKNGCCKGEKYTDLGAQGFNCCLSDKVTCFPPLVVK